MTNEIIPVFFTASPGEVYSSARGDELVDWADEALRAADMMPDGFMSILSRVSETRPKETWVPTVSAAGAELLYGIAIFVAGGISAGLFAEVGTDIWTLVKHGVSKAVGQWKTRHEGKAAMPRRPRIEVSIIEQGSIKVQLSIADTPDDLPKMFESAFGKMDSVIRIANENHAEYLRINEHNFDTENRLRAAHLFLKPPSEITLFDKSQIVTVQFDEAEPNKPDAGDGK